MDEEIDPSGCAPDKGTDIVPCVIMFAMVIVVLPPLFLALVITGIEIRTRRRGNAAVVTPDQSEFTESGDDGENRKALSEKVDADEHLV